MSKLVLSPHSKGPYNLNCFAVTAALTAKWLLLIIRFNNLNPASYTSRFTEQIPTPASSYLSITPPLVPYIILMTTRSMLVETSGKSLVLLRTTHSLQFDTWCHRNSCFTSTMQAFKSISTLECPIYSWVKRSNHGHVVCPRTQV